MLFSSPSWSWSASCIETEISGNCNDDLESSATIEPLEGFWQLSLAPSVIDWWCRVWHWLTLDDASHPKVPSELSPCSECMDTSDCITIICWWIYFWTWIKYILVRRILNCFHPVLLWVLGMVTVLGSFGRSCPSSTHSATCGRLLTRDTRTCADKPWCSRHQESCSVAVVCCTSWLWLISDACPQALLSCSLRGAGVCWHKTPAGAGVFMNLFVIETLF